MRLGCAAYSYREALQAGEMSLEQFVDECARMDLEGVELTSYYFTDTSRSYLNSLKRHCFQRGLHILGTAVGSNFAKADEDAREEQVRMTCEWIDHSVLLGAPVIRVFAGPVPEGVDEETAYGWCLDCIRRCVDYGATEGVVVALENHGGVTTTPEQVQRFLNDIDSPWFGINLDFGNFRDDPYPGYALVAPRTATTHAKVSYRKGDGREPVDYHRVAQVMGDAGYAGYISIEYEEKEDARVAVPRFVETLKAAFR